MLKRVAAATAAVAMIATGHVAAHADVTAPPAGNSQISAPDRYELAVQTSRKTFKQPNVDLVVVATGATFADGLSGGAVAGNAGGPVLLTPPTALPASVRAELQRLNPTAVMISGGTPSVSTDVENSIKAALPKAVVIRHGGKDRYEVAANISRDYYEGGAQTVFVAAGQVYADAVSASSPAALTASPLLLADAALPASTRNELVRLNSTGKLESVVVLGSSASVSDATFRAIDAIVGKNSTDRYPKTVRVDGRDRYEVAAKLASALWDPAQSPAATKAYYVNGLTWADALSAGPAAAANDAPVLLTTKSCMPATTKAFDAANAGTIASRIWVGGVTTVQMSTKQC